jgi:PKD repeat protein
MNRIITLSAFLVFMLTGSWSWGQGQSQSNRYKLSGTQPVTIDVTQSFSATTEITPFPQNVNRITGLAVTAAITLDNEQTSEVRIILVDKDYEEHLVYEAHYLIASGSFTVEQVCEETCILENVGVGSLRIEVTDATVELQSLTYTRVVAPGLDIAKEKRDQKLSQNEDKINRINEKLQERGRSWIAGPTEVGEMTYSERKALFGQSTFPAGFEFYAGGVITAGDDTETIGLKSATASPYVDEWDWRNRHGRNWISPVANQSSCGSCWAFAAAGATEAMVNLFFNQLLNLNLSEQELLSCTSGTCSGGYPSTALNYIASNGIVDEKTFAYVNSKVSCDNKLSNPSDLIKIGGKVDFGSGSWSKTEDNLKKMLIQMGPVSGGLTDWSHAMALVGYKVVKEGDIFFYRDLEKKRYWKTVSAGDPLIGKTVWIFKNSWGTSFGDQGYVYVETAISNMNWTHAIKPSITSHVKSYQVICEDKDGDGYYFWGIGPKPSGCNCPDTPDGDDSDPTRGPIDAYGNFILLSNPPVANFSADKTKITEGGTVQFSDLSTSNTLSWSWSFDGGTPLTSTSKNPSVKYAKAGSYRVSLTATGTDGSHTKTVDNYITVEALLPPVADFTVDRTKVKEGESVQFTDLSTSNTLSWSWTFDGGNPISSTSKNPSVKYAKAGSYRVSLTATGTGGSHTKTVDKYITVEVLVPPVADFTADRLKIKEGESVQFTDLSTSNTLSWSWTFDGGNPSTSTLKNPSVKYASAGNYRVSLTATGTDGSHTKTVENYIAVEAPVAVYPVANFTADRTKVKEGESVQFNDLSTSNTLSWSWIFEGGDPSTSTLKNPSVKYTKAGSYSVSLTATGTDGPHTKTVDNYITVEALVPPVADFTADRIKVKEGESVQFTDLSTSNTLSWSWIFEGGDPSTSTLKNPSVKYTKAGSYSVSLTATGTDGPHTKTVDNYITVEALVPPVANFTADRTKVKEGESVQFTDLSTSNTLSWSWAFDGGTPSTSTLKNPSVKYTKAGSYSVSLTAIGTDGPHTKTVSGYITVEAVVVEPLVAGFTSSGTIVMEGDQVQFFDTSTGSPTGWQWSFPGGTPATSMEQNPVVTYPVAGNYDVSLGVSKEGPAAFELFRENYIQVTEITVPDYCTPVAVNSLKDFISNISLDNGTGSPKAGSGFTLNEDILPLLSGKRYAVTLVPGQTTTRNYWRIWIDFNRDGDFNDSGELLVVQNNKKGTVRTNMVIPSDASGTTRMRVAMRNGSSPGPCDDHYNGEVEDYIVDFSAPNASEIFTSAEILEESVLFSCYPNPVSEVLHVRLGNLEEGAIFNLYNMNGSKMASGHIQSTEAEIHMTSFPQGMYILKVVSGQATFSEKVIKK